MIEVGEPRYRRVPGVGEELDWQSTFISRPTKKLLECTSNIVETWDKLYEQMSLEDIIQELELYPNISLGYSDEELNDEQREVLKPALRFAMILTEVSRVVAVQVYEDNWQLIRDLRSSENQDREFMIRSEQRLQEALKIFNFGELFTPRFSIFPSSKAGEFLEQIDESNLSQSNRKKIKPNGFMVIIGVPPIFLSETFRTKGGFDGTNWRRTAIPNPGFIEHGMIYTKSLEALWELRDNELIKSGWQVIKINKERQHSNGTKTNKFGADRFNTDESEEEIAFHYIWFVRKKGPESKPKKRK
jgi:hypothetical protein